MCLLYGVSASSETTFDAANFMHTGSASLRCSLFHQIPHRPVAQGLGATDRDRRRRTTSSACRTGSFVRADRGGQTLQSPASLARQCCSCRLRLANELSWAVCRRFQEVASFRPFSCWKIIWRNFEIVSVLTSRVRVGKGIEMPAL
jgi:hypothetical protein